jgi:uncharacterized protein (TIGR03435 family)
MGTIRRLAPALLLAGVLYGQRFEVAAVKPSAPDAPEQISVGVHIDGARVSCNSLSLRDYIRMAYRVKDYQIDAPAWMASERYDISATLPDGATQAQVPDMLKDLLADRFKLALHRETRELPVYALVVAKGGVKLQPSAPDPDAAAAAQTPLNLTGGGSRNGIGIDMGHGSYFTFANDKLDAKKLTMVQIADTLTRFVDKPVVDMTGVAGAWDMTLTFTDEDYRAMLIRAAINGGVEVSAAAHRLMEEASVDSLFSAVQGAGLKLDARKAPLDLIVIDRAEKTPSEN